MHIGRKGKQVSIATNIIVAELDEMLHPIFLGMFPHGGETFGLGVSGFHLYRYAFTLIPDEEVQFQTRIFLEVIKALPFLDKRISHKTFKNGTFITTQIALKNIRFYLVSSRPHDPNVEEAEPLHIYASMVGYTVEKKELVPKREYASANANSNTLEVPIQVSEYGPGSVAYTNFFLLSNSTAYSELFLKSETEYRFYRELKRRVDQTAIEEIGENTVFEFGNAKVRMNSSDISIFKEGKLIQQESLSTVPKKANAAFKWLESKLKNGNDSE